MSFSDTPNRLEAVFVQRDTTNVRYDQINVSGSDMIVYLNASGQIDADKISVWAAKYNIGSGSAGTGSAVSASFATSASKAVSASFSETASFALNIIGGGAITQSIYATQSLFSTQSIFASSSLNAISASWASSSLSSSVIFVQPNSTNNNFYVVFVANSGSQPVLIDTASIYYNPSLDLLTVNYVSASSFTGSLLGNATTSTSASFASQSISASLSQNSQTASALVPTNDYTVSTISIMGSSAGVNIFDRASGSRWVNYAHDGMYAIWNSPFGDIFTIGYDTGNIAINATIGVDKLTVGGNISCSVITASLHGNADTSTSASYSPVNPAYSASVASTKQDTLVTGNTYNITASVAKTASLANGITFVPTVAASASVASSSISASYSINAVSASYLSGSVVSTNVVITGNNANLELHDRSDNTQFWTPYASSGHFALWNSQTSADTLIVKLEGSQSKLEVFGNISASVVTASLHGNADSATTSISASFATSASWAPNQFALATGSTYPITSSWSNNALTASALVTGNNYQINNLSASNVSASTMNIAGVSINSLGQFSVQNAGVFDNNTFFAATFGNAVSIKGSGAGFQVADRTNNAHLWQHYAFNDFFRIWNNTSNEFFVMQYSTGKVGLNLPTSSVVNQLDVGGNISCSIITASLHGNADTATTSTSASYSKTASLANGITFVPTVAISASNASQSLSASFATSASYAPNQFSLTTGSTYPITASWSDGVSGSVNGIGPLLNNGLITSHNATASNGNGVVVYADNALAIALSVGGNNSNITYDQNGGFSIQPTTRATVIGGTSPGTSVFSIASGSNNVSVANKLSVNGATQINSLDVLGNISASVVTASLHGNADTSTSASYSPINPAYSASIASGKQDTLVTGNSYNISASWATNAKTSSLATAINFVPTVAESASVASSSISSSFATIAGTANAISFTPATASFAISASKAVSASFATSASWAPNQFALATGSTYPVTASWSNNSTTASNAVIATTALTANAISFVPTVAVSASFSSASISASSALYSNTSFVDDINNGLVVYLPFNEGTGSAIKNYSPYGVDAVKKEFNNTGSTAITGSGWSTNSKRGGYSQFLNVNFAQSLSASWIEMNNATIADSLSQMTFAIWYQSSGSTTNNGRIVTKFNGGTVGAFSYEIFDTNFISVILVNSLAQRVALTVAAPKLNDNKWHHIVGTFDGINNPVYVDGVFIANIPLTGSGLNPTTSPLRIGTFENIGFQPLIGYVDEFKLWNRALSSTEIKYLYNENNLENAIYTDANGNKTISGSTTFLAGATGSLQGSASFATSASYAPNQFALATGSTYPVTASWANNALTASLATAINFTPPTASFATNAATAAFANNLTFTPSLALSANTASFVTGSNVKGAVSTASFLNGNATGSFATFNYVSASKQLAAGNATNTGSIALYDPAGNQPWLLTIQSNQTLDFNGSSISVGNGGAFGAIKLYDGANGVYRTISAEDGGITTDSGVFWDIAGDMSIAGLLNAGSIGVTSLNATTVTASNGHFTGSFKGNLNGTASFIITSSFAGSASLATTARQLNASNNSSIVYDVSSNAYICNVSLDLSAAGIYDGANGVTAIVVSDNGHLLNNINGITTLDFGNNQLLGDWSGSVTLAKTASCLISGSVIQDTITFTGDNSPILIYNRDTALFISASGGTVGIGNGLVEAENGFEVDGGIGFLDIRQTMGTVAVWGKDLPSMSSSIVLTDELTILSGVNTGSSLQSQLDGKMSNTPPTWSALTTGSAVTWSVATNVYEDRKTIRLNGATSMSISGLYNGWAGALEITNATTASVIVITPTPKVLNGGSGALILTTVSASIDTVALRYNGTTLFASVGNNYT